MEGEGRFLMLSCHEIDKLLLNIFTGLQFGFYALNYLQTIREYPVRKVPICPKMERNNILCIFLFLNIYF